MVCTNQRMDKCYKMRHVGTGELKLTRLSEIELRHIEAEGMWYAE